MRKEEFAVYKIAIIGDMSVGKTSLIHRFLKFQRKETKATVAYDVNSVTIIEDNKRIDLNIFDCSGDKQFRDISSDAYKNVKGIIFVYDVSQYESFTNLQESWLKVAEEFMEHDNQCPIFVVANKMDLTEDKRLVKKEEGEHFATAQSASGFFETSALDGLCVEKLFRDVAMTMVDTWGGLHESMSSEAKKSIQTNHKKNSRRRCRRVRELFSCFQSTCCSAKRKHKKRKKSESSHESPIPMATLTHQEKNVNEESVKIDVKDSEISERSEEEEEENQEAKPLKDENCLSIET